jgi:hypothetical protein
LVADKIGCHLKIENKNNLKNENKISQNWLPSNLDLSSSRFTCKIKLIVIHSIVLILFESSALKRNLP